MNSHLDSMAPMSYVHAMGRLLRAFAFLTLISAELTYPRGAQATVTTSTRLIVFTPTVPTNVFSVPFPFIGRDDLTVKHTTVPGGVVTNWIRKLHYSVKLPLGSSLGSITSLVGPVGVEATLTVERVVPITQTVSLTTQGSYSAKAHENIADKLTMIAQQITSSAGVDGTAAVATHVGLADPHAQYAILQGRIGGQHLIGGTASSNNLQLSSTSDAVKGFIIFGSAGNSVYNGLNGRFGFGTTSPLAQLHVVGSSIVSVEMSSPQLVGGSASGGNLTLKSTSHATKGKILFGTSAYDELNSRLGIGTAVPTVSLEVVGATRLGTDLSISSGGDISKTVDNDILSISGDTGVPGTGSAGLLMYGKTHATLAKQVVINADVFSVKSPDGSPMVTVFKVFAPGDSFTEFLGSISNRVFLASSFGLGDTVVSSATASTCGGVFMTATNNAVLSLPASSLLTKGCVVTLVNTAADGSARVDASPDALDGIFGTCTGTTGAGAATIIPFTGVDGKDVTNLLATSNKGDYLKIVSDGVSGWFVIGCIGQWASVL